MLLTIERLSFCKLAFVVLPESCYFSFEEERRLSWP